MRIRPSIVLLACALPVVGACSLNFGADPKTFAPARSPDGATAVLDVHSSAVSGELLTANDSGLVVLTRGRIAFVPYTLVTRATFPDFGYSYLTGGRLPEEATLTRVRLVARYPTGIPAPALATLLAQRGQVAIEVLK